MKNFVLHLKDPGSAITHFIGAILTVCAALPLYERATANGGSTYLTTCIIFMTSMLLLYSASTVYHTFDVSAKINKILKKIDHMMIFVFIAGTYTPICVITLRGPIGYGMLATVWSIAVVGMIIKFFWVTCPKWFSSILYIAMGWVCVFAFAPLYEQLPTSGFYWLLFGGIFYTIGGILYALKLKMFNERFKNFGSHEIFHLFVMAGSICHFIVMYQYVVS